jgi:hypothetical protein
MTSKFEQPYNTPPDYRMAVLSSKKRIPLMQKIAVQEYERSQQCKKNIRREKPAQQFEA